MIRLCIISPSFPNMFCGIGDYTAQLVNSLKGHELEITVITSSHEKVKQFVKSQSMDGVLVLPIIKRWDFFNISTLYKRIKDFKPDIIHIQYHWRPFNDGFILKGLMITLLPLFLKALKVNGNIITTIHSGLNGPYLFPKAAIFRQLALIPLLLFSHRIILTNEFDGRVISNWFPFLKRKIAYIKGGAGHYLINSLLINEDISRIKSQFKNSTDEIILSNFGFMIPYKGLEELLLALSLLRKKGYPLKLLAVGGFDIEPNLGGYSFYFSKLSKMTDDLKLTPFVKWTGFCDSKRASSFLLASDICVMPFWDGVRELRSSFIAVLSHGLPIITTYSRHTPKELVDHTNVLLVPARNQYRLAEAIEELANSPQLRTELGRAARKLYEEKYSWDIIAAKTLRVYQGKER